MLPFAATWVDLENIILSEFRKRQILYGRFYVESKIWIYIENRNRLTYTEKFMVTKEEREGEKNKIEVMGLTYKTTIHKIDTQQGFTV